MQPARSAGPPPHVQLFAPHPREVRRVRTVSAEELERASDAVYSELTTAVATPREGAPIVIPHVIAILTSPGHRARGGGDSTPLRYPVLAARRVLQMVCQRLVADGAAPWLLTVRFQSAEIAAGRLPGSAERSLTPALVGDSPAKNRPGAGLESDSCRHSNTVRYVGYRWVSGTETPRWQQLTPQQQTMLDQTVVALWLPLERISARAVRYAHSPPSALSTSPVAELSGFESLTSTEWSTRLERLVGNALAECRAASAAQSVVFAAPLLRPAALFSRAELAGRRDRSPPAARNLSKRHRVEQVVD
jgi:hypothetical protein